MQLLFLLMLFAGFAFILFMMPGWKSALALYASYVVGFYLISRPPVRAPGPCGGPAECNGMAAGDLIMSIFTTGAWILIALLGLARLIYFFSRQR
jgi:hypothetical protein